jgi:hypothetical protein
MSQPIVIVNEAQKRVLGFFSTTLSGRIALPDVIRQLWKVAPVHSATTSVLPLQYRRWNHYRLAKLPTAPLAVLAPSDGQASLAAAWSHCGSRLLRKSLHDGNLKIVLNRIDKS